MKFSIDNKENDNSEKVTSDTIKKIKIGRFKGNSPEFVNLVEGSIHDVVECPLRYRDRDLQKGFSYIEESL